MKKLFSLLMIVFTTLSITASAQATSIKIVNNSHCEICFYLLGSKAPRCLPIVSKTTTICIPAGATVTYPNAAAAPFAPPLAPGDLFVGLCWYNHNPSLCPDIPLVQRCIYDRCAGSPQTDNMDVFGSDCKFCANVKGTWTTSGSMATVVFN
jgi:hypothetical protein